MTKHNLDVETEVEIKTTNKLEDFKVKYIFSSAHRRTQKDKAKWIISTHEELACFKNAQINKYLENKGLAWGYLKTANNFTDLGINGHKEILKIAKFVDKNEVKIWHGYPADFARNPQDRPSIDILRTWRTNQVIEKHQILKIRQGKTCNL
ncbi:hypothetical protein [Flavobacterium sp. 22076]|uniref:hypothetical protein n=1 Tax=unclassified Flavobacterium TaxID=196869 RepID=UPI003F84A746